LKIVSLFSGCGGLDLGFTNAGFHLVYANDNDPVVWETFEKNHHILIDERSLFDIKSKEIPKADGIIGGPPCQSWSLAGEMRGSNDERGQLFYEYIRVLKDKKPKFFLAENVPGIISITHLPEFKKILNMFSSVGYEISFELLDARNYGIPQERKRVIIVGLRKPLKSRFVFPRHTYSKQGNKTLDGQKTKKWLTLKDAIGDLPEPVRAKDKNKANDNLTIPNHEYMNGSFSSIYMSRNRRRTWNEPSFTIQAGGRHAPLHPSSTEMEKVEKDLWRFKGGTPVFRRVSVREAARIQTFPDNFIFYYKNIADGYKMIGNAVPVKLAQVIAQKIKTDLSKKPKSTSKDR
jgi:DNA (cytosine-5)-methyltransferase 1